MVSDGRASETGGMVSDGRRTARNARNETASGPIEFLRAGWFPTCAGLFGTRETKLPRGWVSVGDGQDGFRRAMDGS